MITRAMALPLANQKLTGIVTAAERDLWARQR
jgi:hypothetical protein